MIDGSVQDAVERYYDPQYAASCVSEWVAQHLGVPVDAGKLDPSAGFEALASGVRDLTVYEVRGSVQRVFG